jgi:hypothetical protein
MEAANLNHTKNAKIATIIYFGLAAILVLSEVFKLREILVFFKPFLIPTLGVLYYMTSTTRNLWYTVSLIFAVASNIFLLSMRQEYVMFGLAAFMIFRIISIIIVIKASDRIVWLPLILATIPYLLIFSLLTSLIEDLTFSRLYLSIINGLTISFFSGMALSNYVMVDKKQYLWLLISSLFFMALAFIFIFQKYYVANPVFPPLSAIIFVMAHYFFYLYMIESEKIIPE